MRALPLLLICLAAVVPAWASESLPSVADYVKRSPAYIAGQLTFSQDHRVFGHELRGRSVVTAYIRAGEPINVELTESEITLSSKKGLIIRVAGIPVQITRLNYDNRTGDVHATSAIFGTRLHSSWLEARAEEAVRTKFGAKLRTAFMHIDSLRSQTSLDGVGQALNDVVDSFKDAPSPLDSGKPHRALPDFEGHLTLVLPVEEAATLQVGRMQADLEPGDVLATTFMIRVPSRKKLQIHGLAFTTRVGIRLHKPGAAKTSLSGIELHSVTATEEDGFRVDAQNGVDGAISGAAFAFSSLAGQIPRGSSGTSTVVQEVIESKASTKMSVFASTNEAGLLRAGLTPALVQTLENSP